MRKRLLQKRQLFYRFGDTLHTHDRDGRGQPATSSYGQDTAWDQQSKRLRDLWASRQICTRSHGSEALMLTPPSGNPVFQTMEEGQLESVTRPMDALKTVRRVNFSLTIRDPSVDLRNACILKKKEDDCSLRRNVQRCEIHLG